MCFGVDAPQKSDWDKYNRNDVAANNSILFMLQYYSDFWSDWW